MRLNAPITSKFVGDVDGLRADVLDQILGTAERKRSRPTSSLDIKVDRVKQTIAPSRKQQQQQTSQRTSQRKTTSPITRPRRGGGIPPKFDFSQLEGLTEEQIRLALAQDPELAAAAAAAAAAEKNMFATQKRQSPYYRNKDGHVKNINDYPAHLRSMMEDGIPVKQWIILFILLGAGLYQLRKNMFTTKVEKSSKKITSTKKASRKVGTKKGKRILSPAVKEKDAFQSVSDEKSPPPLQEKEEESAALDNGKETPMTDAKKQKASTKKKLKPTSKKLQPDKTTRDESPTADQEKSRESPDYSAPANGSSTAELVVAVDLEECGALGSIESLSHVREKSEGEWQTVGKGSPAEKSQSKNGNQVQDAALDPAVNDAVNDITNATTSPDVSKKVAVETTVNPTKKKKKKNKSANDPKSPAQPEVLSTQDDEALAMKLQQQEEKLAEVDSRPTSEDIWAPVTLKKSKCNKGQTETGGTETSLA